MTSVKGNVFFLRLKIFIFLGKQQHRVFFGYHDRHVVRGKQGPVRIQHGHCAREAVCIHPGTVNVPLANVGPHLVQRATIKPFHVVYRCWTLRIEHDYVFVFLKFALHVFYRLGDAGHVVGQTHELCYGMLPYMIDGGLEQLLRDRGRLEHVLGVNTECLPVQCQVNGGFSNGEFFPGEFQMWRGIFLLQVNS